MKVVDAGHEATELILGDIEEKVRKVYSRAAKETEAKLNAYLRGFEKRDTEKRALLEAGKITSEEYAKWRYGQICIGNRWQDMADTLALDLVNSDKIAMSIVNGYLPDVYALNANYGAYQLEHGLGVNTSWTLYDRNTVERLIRDEPNLLPKPKVEIPKDLRWNKQHIVGEITQGVLQGEAMPKIAKRLETVVGMDKVAAMRNARTAVTGAQNAGRVEAYMRAEDMGITVKQEWLASHDGRTRESHAEMDGEQIEIGGVFSNGCRYPGDPGGPPEEVYNCRCTMIPALGSLGQIEEEHKDGFDEWLKRLEEEQQEYEENRIQDAIADARVLESYEHTQMHFSYDIWEDELMQEQRDAVRNYTGSAYNRMNRTLRRDEFDNANTSLKEEIANCESTIARFHLQEDTYLYRGMGSYRSLARSLGVDYDSVDALLQDGSIVGQRFTEKGFCSTGINPGAGWDKEISLEIVAPKGTCGMYVDPISKCQGEEELLLQRGTTFEVFGVEESKSGYVLQVVVREQPDYLLEVF